MKMTKLRFFCLTVTVALLCTILLACGSNPSPVPTQPTLTQTASTPTVPVSGQVASTSDDLDTAIREASDYLNKQLPKGNKLLILNVQSEYLALSEYIIDELIANTVNDRFFSVVDRQQLNVIRAELTFQFSGEVDDATAQALGRMAGAQIIISGAVSRIGDLYRLRVRALSVQSAQIQGQFNRNIKDGPMLSALVRSRATGYGGSTDQSGTALVSGTSATTTTHDTQAVSPQVTTVVITPQGNNLSQKLAWIANQGGDGTIYDIVVNSDENLRSTMLSTRGRKITINIRCENSVRPKTIQLTGQGALFSVDTDVTLILQNIILRGHNNNNLALVLVKEGGTIILNSGAKVTGNTNSSGYGGGITATSAVIELNDGAEVSGNSVGGTYAYGGGIYTDRTTVTIKGGKITENTATIGTYPNGGGLFLNNYSTCIMSGGEISRNRASHNGGGVHTFNASTFIKKAASGSNTSGVIYGSNGGVNANIAGRRGQAIIHYDPRETEYRRNTTLGEYNELNTESNTGWD